MLPGEYQRRVPVRSMTFGMRKLSTDGNFFGVGKERQAQKCGLGDRAQTIVGLAMPLRVGPKLPNPIEDTGTDAFCQFVPGDFGLPPLAVEQAWHHGFATELVADCGALVGSTDGLKQVGKMSR